MTQRDHLARIISLVLFRSGQLLLLVGYVLFMLGVMTSHWVERPPIDYSKNNIDPLQVTVIKHFGIFSACTQGADTPGASSECGSMTSKINYVDAGAIQFVQALMIISCILYLVGFILDAIQFMPISKFRNFLAENRMVEMFSGIATVIALIAMVIYAGEVKNKAELVSGQEDEAVGWSFIVAIVGLSLCIVGLLMITMFRHLPMSPGNSQPAKGGSWLRIKSSSNNEIH